MVSRWGVLLSHARPGELDRCLAVPLGGRRVHLCARCAGLYPALALGLWARLAAAGWVEDRPWLAVALRLGVPLAGGAAWALEQAGLALPRSGAIARAARTASGVALGAGLGWVLGLHLRSPWPRELIELGAGLVVILVAGVIARTLRATREKTPVHGQNEVDPGSS